MKHVIDRRNVTVVLQETEPLCTEYSQNTVGALCDCQSQVTYGLAAAFSRCLNHICIEGNKGSL